MSGKIVTQFLLSSFRSTIEAHWTLSAGISLVVLFVHYLSRAPVRTRNLLQKLLMANVILLLIARILFVIPESPLKNITGFHSIFHGERLADSIHVKASEKPVVFVNSYTQASLYKYYYNDALTTSYNTIPNRKNYFNLSGDEWQLNNKDVLIATGYDFGKPSAIINGFKDPVKIYELDSFRAINGITIELYSTIKEKFSANEIVDVRIMLRNLSGGSITSNGRLYLNYNLIKSRKEYYSSPPVPVMSENLITGFKTELTIRLKMPAEKGKYSLVFSIVQYPFLGAFSSPFYEVEVE